MANIGLDGRIHNDENGQDVPLRSKQLASNDGRPLKKQVFGELKNVMHGQQQIGATPAKANAAKIDGLPGKFAASSSSLCNDLLRKQHLKNNFLDAQQFEAKHKTATSVELYKEPIFDEGIFDSWDYERKCCEQQRAEEEIWSEMDLECLNFDRLEYRCTDEPDLNDCSKNSSIFEDFDDDLQVPAFDSMIEFEEPPLCEMPKIFDDFEDLTF